MYSVPTVADKARTRRPLFGQAYVPRTRYWLYTLLYLTTPIVQLTPSLLAPLLGFNLLDCPYLLSIPRHMAIELYPYMIHWVLGARQANDEFEKLFPAAGTDWAYQNRSELGRAAALTGTFKDIGTIFREKSYRQSKSLTVTEDLGLVSR
ncbi:hypothetical protein AcW1_002441 [Taiwanofungus camphoratus]|nr:hypothetical protein AcW1_002441 [Antrodia cinnamomea]